MFGSFKYTIMDFNVNNSIRTAKTAPGQMLTTAPAMTILATGNTLRTANAMVTTASAMLTKAPQHVPCLMWHYLIFKKQNLKHSNL